MNNSTENSKLRMFVTELADINYYNNMQKIIRVKVGDSEHNTFHYDVYLSESNVYPNPEDHRALVITNQDIINESTNGMLLNDPKLDLLPGYKNERELNDNMLFGYAILLNRKITNNTTGYNDASTASFNREARNPEDSNNIKYSLSPGLNKSYTTVNTAVDSDPNYENIGVFITDNSVLLKSHGGSILLGPEGISMLGLENHSHTKGGQGIMMDNPFSGWVPATVMTVPLGIEMIPNYNEIIGFGTAAVHLTKAASAVGDMANVVSSIA